jgi:hypothetical protein
MLLFVENKCILAEPTARRWGWLLHNAAEMAACHPIANRSHGKFRLNSEFCKRLHAEAIGQSPQMIKLFLLNA